MIVVSDRDRRNAYVPIEKIVSIRPTEASSRWHGINSIVYTSDGKTIESSDEAETLRNRFRAAIKDRQPDWDPIEIFGYIYEVVEEKHHVWLVQALNALKQGNPPPPLEKSDVVTTG